VTIPSAKEASTHQRRLSENVSPITVFFRGLAWLLVAAIVVITLAPPEFRPDTELSGRMERFVAFAAVTGVFCLGYPKYRLHIIVLIVGLIVLLEVGQKFAPDRHGKLLKHGIPKVLGALFGAAFAILRERCIKHLKGGA
jgi:VanZ family protein